jgi:hypothetical protein
VAAAAVALLGLLLAPGAAWAGGPTSVLLASPTSDQATGLYYSDPEYDQLMALLDPAPGAATGPADAGYGAEQVNVTWMIHDVSVWRVDRILLDAAGGAWISTYDTLGEGSTGTPGPGEPGETGHPATDPQALRALLTDLGLLGSPVAAARQPGPAVAEPAALANPAPVTSGPPAAATTDDQRDGVWWWAAAGGVIGAGALAIGLRASTTLRRRLLPAA